MKLTDMTPDPMTELLSIALDGELTDEQRERLAHLLKTDPEARRRYLDFMLLDSLLQEELGDESLVGLVDMMGGGTSESSDQPANPISQPAPRNWPARIAWALVGCAVVVLLGLLASHFFIAPRPSPLPPLQRESVLARARVVELDGQVELVSSKGDTRDLRVGDEVHAGESLRTIGDSSFAVIDFDKVGKFELNPGTQVRLVKNDTVDGPAKLFLSHGVLRTETRANAKQPLVVATPHAEILGTNAHFTCSSLSDTTWIEVEQGQAKVIRQADGRPMSVESGFKTVVNLDPAPPKSIAAPQFGQRPVFEILHCPSRTIAFTADGKSLLMAGTAGRFWRFDFDKNKESLIFEEKKLGTDRTLLSTDARLLAFAFESVIHLRSAGNMEPLPSIETRLKNVRAFALSPDGRRAAMIHQTPRDPRRVRVWNTSTGAEEVNLPSPVANLGALAFSRDGNLLAGGSSRGGVILWDLPRQEEIGRWEGMSSAVDMLAFSPEEKRLAAIVGSQIVFWDIASKQQIKRITEPGLEFRSLAFDPEGKIVAAGTASGELSLWNVSTWQKIATFKTDSRPITVLAFSPDGKSVAAATSRPIRIWRIPDEVR
ncbi:MAG: hypothetical protein FJ303_08485 [Planctomycetes bacterium]|nr:hypothetical protein [Planctomycetota bacterium]